MNRAEILNKAIDLTTGNREADYGPPVKAHRDIAVIGSIMTGHTLTSWDIAMIMVAVKMVRAKQTPTKMDTLIDGAAYMAIAAECAGDK